MSTTKSGSAESTRATRAGPHGSTLTLLPVRRGVDRLHPAGAQAAELLRAQEYIVRRKWLGVASATPGGGETDRYDDQATHFAVLDTSSEPDPTAVATVRFIAPTDGRLPLLEIFPELSGTVAGAHEVSRYIALVTSASHALRAVILAYLLTNDVRGVAVITPGLRRVLSRQAFVLHDLSDRPKMVAMYGSQPQIAVEIDAIASAGMQANARMVELAVAQDWDGVMEAANVG